MKHDPITFADTASHLHAMGYRPFPGHQESKVPAMRGWNGLNKLAWDDADLDVCIDDYQPVECYCCCVAVQPELVVADIDVTDPIHAEFADDLADRLLGPTPLIRIGLWPKQARVYRNDGSVQSHKLHPLEIFAGSGQVVAYGWHAGAQSPYHWKHRTMFDTPAESTEIPVISRSSVERFETELFRVVPRRIIVLSSGRRNRTINEHLRLRTQMLGSWKRAAAEVLAGATEGQRNDTMWAVVTSAAGRGIDDDMVRGLFDKHFSGWGGVTRDEVDFAIERCQRSERELSDWTPQRGPIRRLRRGGNFS
jgi:hypothetical protein